MRHIRAFALLALVAAAGKAAGASADDLGIGWGRWSGMLGLAGDGGSQSTSDAGGSTNASSTRHLGEALGLARGYYLIDPRLVNGSLGLQLYRNRDSGASAEANSSTKSRFVGYSFDASMLTEKPYNANLYANRNQRQSIPTFGGRTEGTLESRGLSLRLEEDSELKNWGLPWFSANFQLRREDSAETTTVFGNTLTRNEGRKTLDLDLSKGFESADLSVRYQLGEVENRELPQVNYRSRTAALTYSLDFGANLSRRFDSRINWVTHDGNAPITTLSADEQLRIEHLQNLTSAYQYNYSRQNSAGLTSTGQSGSGSISHLLYRTLSTSASLSGSVNTLPGGSTSSRGGSLGQGYQYSLPGDGRVFANWSGSYQKNSNQLSVSLIDVPLETHSAPSPLGAGAGFVLDHDFAVAASIVVIDTRGGLRVTTVKGVDYDIVAEGSRTRIVPLVGSLVMRASDPLELRYSYNVDPNLEFARKIWSLSGGVSYGWFALSLRHAQSDQQQLSGARSRFLEDSRDDVAQIDLHGNWRGVGGRASASFESYRATSLVYDRRLLTSVLTWRPVSELYTVVALTASDTQFWLPARTSSTRSARGSLLWQAPGGWSNNAFAELSTNNEQDLISETVRRAGARSSWHFGLLTLGAGVSFSEFLRGQTRSRDSRLDFSAVRAF